LGSAADKASSTKTVTIPINRSMLMLANWFQRKLR
jgi:hypothetical protein